MSAGGVGNNWSKRGQRSKHDSRPRLSDWLRRRGEGRKRSRDKRRRKELRP